MSLQRALAKAKKPCLEGCLRLNFSSYTVLGLGCIRVWFVSLGFWILVFFSLWQGVGLSKLEES